MTVRTPLGKLLAQHDARSRAALHTRAGGRVSMSFPELPATAGTRSSRHFSNSLRTRAPAAQSVGRTSEDTAQLGIRRVRSELGQAARRNMLLSSAGTVVAPSLVRCRSEDACSNSAKAPLGTFRRRTQAAAAAAVASAFQGRRVASMAWDGSHYHDRPYEGPVTRAYGRAFRERAVN